MLPAVMSSPYQATALSGAEEKTGYSSSQAANFMPSATSAGRRMSPANPSNSLDRDYSRQRPILINPRLAPSTITTERALEARR